MTGTPETESAPAARESRAAGAAQNFRVALDQHGYGFQYALIERARELLEEHRSRWVFEAAEFPVAVQSHTTRVDFILGHQRERTLWLVAECKRANPALANWCFARAPYRRRGQSETQEAYQVDAVTRRRHDGITVAMASIERVSTYHIGVEVETGAKGDRHGGKEGIESAVSQVLRGTNGLIEHVRANPSAIPEMATARLIPVVFTTAALWASDVALERSSLESGKGVYEKDNFRQVPWLAYQYNTSPGLLHTQPIPDGGTSLSETLTKQFTRTIAIVSPSGVDEFLSWAGDALTDA